MKKELKVAIIHHWWLVNRGAERVIKAMVEIYPNADLYIHVYDEDLVRNTLGSEFKGNIYSSFIAKLPFAKKYYQKYLPLMPLALEQLDLSKYDLIISSESGPSKGVITRPDALHVCYCNSPMRYLWDLYSEYLANSSKFIRIAFPLIAHWLRVWDRVSADRVDFFIANSTFIASRIKKFYRREAEVIFPPVNVGHYNHQQKKDNFYLYMGALVVYKRADLAVEVFNKLGLPLVVIGEGDLFEKLKAIAKPNVQILGRLPESSVKDYMQRCKALVFPGLEDFGIVPVEAMAAGAPVIAYKKGGVLDTVIENITGVFFEEQTIESMSEAVLKIENNEIQFDINQIRAHAEQFDKSIFKEKLKESINVKLQNFN